MRSHCLERGCRRGRDGPATGGLDPSGLCAEALVASAADRVAFRFEASDLLVGTRLEPDPALVFFTFRFSEAPEPDSGASLIVEYFFTGDSPVIERARRISRRALVVGGTKILNSDEDA